MCEKLQNELKENEDCSKRIRKITQLIVKEGETAAQAVEACLRERAADKRNFYAVEKNNTELSDILESAGVYSLFASYRFDSKRMKFEEISNCEMLGYIRKISHITVADMMAFRRLPIESRNKPEFFRDYNVLWHKYKENRELWKSLCSLLGKYSEDNDELAAFRKDILKDGKQERKKFYYILPLVCIEGAEKVIRLLKEQKIVMSGSSVKELTSESCEAVVKGRECFKKLFDKLFANIFALMLPDSIRVCVCENKVKVVFDNPKVKDLEINDNVLEIKGLMKYFSEKGYVINLSFSEDNKMSFTYGTRQIKELLSTAGRILEIYMYHKIKEAGEFDDVVNGYEISWDEIDAKCKFDCIITKGFRSLFVKCSPAPDSYKKICSEVRKLGINASCVMITDTQEGAYDAREAAEELKGQDGNQTDAVIIWKQEEIEDIGQTLLKVINGEYDHL